MSDLTKQMAEALRTGLEMTQELLAMKREALGDDYQWTRAYFEAERELSAALAAFDAQQAAPMSPKPVSGTSEPAQGERDAWIDETMRLVELVADSEHANGDTVGRIHRKFLREHLARAALAQQPAARVAPVHQPVHQPVHGWTDADADSARLALELECLLTDKDMPIATVSRWWDSAHEALRLHRERLDGITAPAAQGEQG